MEFLKWAFSSFEIWFGLTVWLILVLVVFDNFGKWIGMSSTERVLRRITDKTIGDAFNEREGKPCPHSNPSDSKP